MCPSWIPFVIAISVVVVAWYSADGAVIQFVIGWCANWPSRQASVHSQRLAFPPPSRSPDTTAIVLNWSRLSNVVYIASILCSESLNHAIQTVFIWNNNPNPLTHKDFIQSSCPENKLTIYNSPENVYFQARFMACAQANTSYCFMQDDDFVVWPEVLTTLHARFSESSSPGIHLLPPHERLSSDLKRVEKEPYIHASFAWLGHGAIIRQSRAVQFLSLFKELNMSAEQFKMADNYYTLLSNTVADTWFDQGHELGGGTPFTVGPEGDQRNNKHIINAARLLDEIFCDSSPCSLSDAAVGEYVSSTKSSTRTMTYAPCKGVPCLFGTSTRLLPASLSHSVNAAEEILESELNKRELLGEEYISQYISNSPSHAVDNDIGSAFCAPDNVASGDVVSLDVLHDVWSHSSAVNFHIVTNANTLPLLDNATYETSPNGIDWVPSGVLPSCVESITTPRKGSEEILWECKIHLLPSYTARESRHFRVRFTDLDDLVSRRLCIYEIYIGYFKNIGL
ncbi:hypothetical protein BDN72DRAFT_808273 [Pluteus cervinus]|uniref:Uncharacterized protein n=1 Tax=Pluteus cervinus TaxID=181527 RepID=A0ACD3BHR6_9AGAR|nr:hypothetical protein BDN72DRAFT_808273 [Pluteus cervinus]